MQAGLIILKAFGNVFLPQFLMQFGISFFILQTEGHCTLQNLSRVLKTRQINVWDFIWFL